MSLPVSDPRHYAPVTRPYRRWLAVSAALLLHLAVIGGVANWRLAPAPAERTSLDVVLVTRPAESPEQAEAIAERNQRAQGERERETLAEARAAASREATPAPPTSRAEAAAPATTPSPPPDAPATETPAEEAPREPSPAAAPGQSAPEASAPPAPEASPSRSGRDLLAQATERIREQGLSPDPSGAPSDARQRAARQAAEARYIDDWTRRVEDYGNRVHPAPRDLEGQLRIRVVIGHDGELRQAEVIQSSGHAELDQAALATVRGAAPYRPFDRGMGNLDSLSITRVWRFGQGNHYGVQ